jgi:hypothetical protein
MCNLVRFLHFSENKLRKQRELFQEVGFIDDKLIELQERLACIQILQGKLGLT